MAKAAEKKQTLAKRVRFLEEVAGERRSEGVALDRRVSSAEKAAHCVQYGHVWNVDVRAKASQVALEIYPKLEPESVVASRTCPYCERKEMESFALQKRRDRKAFLAFLRG